MGVFAAWSAVVLLTALGVAALVRALRSQKPKDAMRVTGAGCLTFTSGVVVLGLVLRTGVRQLRADLTYESSARLIAYIDSLSPPGYVGLVTGLVLVTLGAWLRGAARETRN